MLFMTLLGIVQPAFAGSSCIHDGEPATMIFQLPASLQLESDTAVGTIVFEQTLDSGEIKMTCSSVGNKYKGYTSLTDADARSDVLEGISNQRARHWHPYGTSAGSKYLLYLR